MGEVIAIISQKGGVGKTTTAVNLSASMGVLDQKTLLIDMDPQGSVSASFGLNRYDISSGMFEVLTQNLPLPQAIMHTELRKLDIIPANTWTEEEENTFISSASNNSQLKSQIQAVVDQYDYILIDCPPSLSALTTSALIAADSVLIPIQCEYYSLKALGRLMKLVRSVNESSNPNLKYKGFLLTMVDTRTKITKQIIEELQNSLKDLLFQTVVPRNVRLAEVPMRGKPAILFDASSPGSTSYLKLAEEILSKNNHPIGA